MRRRTSLAAATAVAVMGLLSGCGGVPPEPFVSSGSAGARSGPSAASTDTPGPPPRLTSEGLNRDFATFAHAHPGGLSLAWAPVGDPEAVQTLGTVEDQDAWSTFKVPISIAAVNKAGEDDRYIAGLVRKAITISDNDAAYSLWVSLGGPRTAARRTDAVLRAGGDTRTQAGEDEDGRSHGFGRTLWRVDDAARFASSLPCSDDAAPVYRQMSKSRISPDHRWGMGSVAFPTHFKGGWGESEHGYLVRQIGVVEVSGGQIAMALVVQPRDHTDATATATASDAAAWLVSRFGPSDVGHCPGEPRTSATTGSGASSTDPSAPDGTASSSGDTGTGDSDGGGSGSSGSSSAGPTASPGQSAPATSAGPTRS